MFSRSTSIRLLAISALEVWGPVECIALQRAHGLQRKQREPQYGVLPAVTVLSCACHRQRIPLELLNHSTR
jgi:hypothetical protein